MFVYIKILYCSSNIIGLKLSALRLVLSPQLCHLSGIVFAFLLVRPVESRSCLLAVLFCIRLVVLSLHGNVGRLLYECHQHRRWYQWNRSRAESCHCCIGHRLQHLWTTWLVYLLKIAITIISSSSSSISTIISFFVQGINDPNLESQILSKDVTGNALDRHLTLWCPVGHNMYLGRQLHYYNL